MTTWLIPLLTGFLCGILSSWGVGGGTLLLLIMTLFLDVEPSLAQGINLLYFLPTAAVGLYYHHKNGLLDKTAIRTAIPWGIAAAVLGAVISTAVDTSLLRRPFGVYLLVMGLSTLLKKKQNAVQK